MAQTRRVAGTPVPDTARPAPMERWVAVIDAFTRRPEWGIRELASATGISRSAMSRIVGDMTALGLLARAGDAGPWAIGPELVRLALGLSDRADIVRVARPVLEDLRDTTGETAILSLYDRARRRFRAVLAAESAHPIRYIWESLQEWNDLERGASGKGILAFLPPGEQAAVIEALPARPGRADPPLDRAALQADLDRCREQGYVISHGERFRGAVGVSAPVHDHAGRVVGDVLLGWPDNRTDPDKEQSAAHAACRAADRISAALGHRRP